MEFLKECNITLVDVVRSSLLLVINRTEDIATEDGIFSSTPHINYERLNVAIEAAKNPDGTISYSEFKSMTKRVENFQTMLNRALFLVLTPKTAIVTIEGRQLSLLHLDGLIYLETAIEEYFDCEAKEALEKMNTMLKSNLA
jgi:hypothetical protein